MSNTLCGCIAAIILSVAMRSFFVGLSIFSADVTPRKMLGLTGLLVGFEEFGIKLSVILELLHIEREREKSNQL